MISIRVRRRAAILGLIAFAAPAFARSQPSVLLRISSAEQWRGYDRGVSAIALANLTYGLLGYEADGISPYSVWVDAESSTPIDQRHEQNVFDEGRARLAIEAPTDPNEAHYFVGGAVTYFASKLREAHDLRAAEFSARGGWHFEGEPWVPTTLRLGVDHFTDTAHASRVTAQVDLRVPVPTMPVRIAALVAWSNYSEQEGQRSGFGPNDMALDVNFEHTLLHAITFESGLRLVRGWRPGMPWSVPGIYLGVRRGQRSSRVFDPWGL